MTTLRALVAAKIVRHFGTDYALTAETCAGAIVELLSLRLGDEKVVNETAIAIGEVVMRKGTLGEMARAALAAALSAAHGD